MSKKDSESWTSLIRSLLDGTPGRYITDKDEINRIIEIKENKVGFRSHMLGDYYDTDVVLSEARVRELAPLTAEDWSLYSDDPEARAVAIILREELLNSFNNLKSGRTLGEEIERMRDVLGRYNDVGAFDTEPGTIMETALVMYLRALNS